MKTMLAKTLELMKISNPKALEENFNLNMECCKCSNKFTFGIAQLLEIDFPKTDGEKLSSVIEVALLKRCQ